MAHACVAGIVCASVLLSGCDVEQLFHKSLPIANVSETKQATYAYERALFEPESGILISIGQDVDSINDYVSTVTVQPVDLILLGLSIMLVLQI